MFSDCYDSLCSNYYKIMSYLLEIFIIMSTPRELEMTSFQQILQLYNSCHVNTELMRRNFSILQQFVPSPDSTIFLLQPQRTRAEG